MANTTFSGPIRAGNIRNTVGTTVGTDVANVGYVVMMQTHSMDLSNGAIAAGATNMVIPANSKIINCIVEIFFLCPFTLTKINKIPAIFIINIIIKIKI